MGVVVYVLALMSVVVTVDILLLRHHFTERLIANLGTVLVFAAFGFLMFRGLGRRQEMTPAGCAISPPRGGSRDGLRSVGSVVRGAAPV